MTRNICWRYSSTVYCRTRIIFCGNIDSIVRLIDNDNAIIKHSYDTASYEREDSGKNGDSSYRHEEYFYKTGKLIKAIAWTKYRSSRHDVIFYYQNDKTIRFLKGELFKGQPDYGSLESTILLWQGQKHRSSMA